MTAQTVKDIRLLKDTRAVLDGLGYDFSWVLLNKEISQFRTRKKVPIHRFPGDWDIWDAELGAQDLAFMLAMIVGLKT